jgi:hypothetical protein
VPAWAPVKRTIHFCENRTSLTISYINNYINIAIVGFMTFTEIDCKEDLMHCMLGAPTDAFIFPFEPLPAKPLHYDLSDVKSGASVSDWTRISLEAVAPAGTSSARVYLLHINDSFGASGSIRWDDVSLTAVPDSQVPVPATLALFGLGLAGLGLARLRLSRRART